MGSGIGGGGEIKRTGRGKVGFVCKVKKKTFLKINTFKKKDIKRRKK